MPRKISKKRARYLEKRGEFVDRSIPGQWWWSGPRLLRGKPITYVNALKVEIEDKRFVVIRGRRAGRAYKTIRDLRHKLKY